MSDLNFAKKRNFLRRGWMATALTVRTDGHRFSWVLIFATSQPKAERGTGHARTCTLCQISEKEKVERWTAITPAICSNSVCPFVLRDSDRLVESKRLGRPRFVRNAHNRTHASQLSWVQNSRLVSKPRNLASHYHYTV